MPLKGPKWILKDNVFLTNPQRIYHVFVCHKESVKLDFLTLGVWFCWQTLNILVKADDGEDGSKSGALLIRSRLNI